MRVLGIFKALPERQAVAITDVTGENNDLRKVVVTIVYQNGTTTRTFTLTTYLSSFA